MDNTQEEEIISQPTLTPLPKIQGKAMTMDFPGAMREIIKGNKVARLEWGNPDYGLLKDSWLTIFAKGAFHTWLVNDGDLLAQDWVIVTDNTLYSPGLIKNEAN